MLVELYRVRIGGFCVVCVCMGGVLSVCIESHCVESKANKGRSCSLEDVPGLKPWSLRRE
jgi:hypothetical protein